MDASNQQFTMKWAKSAGKNKASVPHTQREIESGRWGSPRTARAARVPTWAAAAALRPTPLPPQRPLVLGLRLGGRTRGLRCAPPAGTVRAPEREREREVPQRLSRGCRAWKETAAAAQEKKSVGGRAAAATGSRSKITEKIANKWNQQRKPQIGEQIERNQGGDDENLKIASPGGARKGAELTREETKMKWNWKEE